VETCVSVFPLSDIRSALRQNSGVGIGAHAAFPVSFLSSILRPLSTLLQVNWASQLLLSTKSGHFHLTSAPLSQRRISCLQSSHIGIVDSNSP
jgi:hypothetical protein